MPAPRSDPERDGHGEKQGPSDRARRIALPLVIVVAANVLSVYALGRIADPHGTLTLLRSASGQALGLAAGLLVVSLAAKSLRWRALLPTPHTVRAFEAYRSFHASILLNNVLPFRLGDSARVLSAPVRRSVPARQALLVLRPSGYSTRWR